MNSPPMTRPKPFSMQSHDWTIASLLGWTTTYFQQHEIDSPRATAEILLAHGLGLRRIDLYLRYDQPLNPDELARFKTLVRRRMAREPVAYITGVKEFWSLELRVTPDVLIPRPETECLVEAALAQARAMPPSRPLRILDLCTGSGAIIIALATQRPDDCLIASDVSPEAIAVARENTRRHGLDDRIHLVAADWLSAFGFQKQPFDLIVSNPPYIDAEAFKTLQPEVRDHEPRRALDGRHGGLMCLERILNDAHRFLKADGYLLLEIGHDQRARLETMIRSSGRYDDPVFSRDYGGFDRVVQMRRI